MSASQFTRSMSNVSSACYALGAVSFGGYFVIQTTESLAIAEKQDLEHECALKRREYVRQQNENNAKVQDKDVKSHDADKDVKSHDADRDVKSQDVKSQDADKDVKSHDADKNVKSQGRDIKSHDADKNVKSQDADKDVKSQDAGRDVKEVKHTTMDANGFEPEDKIELKKLNKRIRKARRLSATASTLGWVSFCAGLGCAALSLISS